VAVVIVVLVVVVVMMLRRMRRMRRMRRRMVWSAMVLYGYGYDLRFFCGACEGNLVLPR